MHKVTTEHCGKNSGTGFVEDKGTHKLNQTVKCIAPITVFDVAINHDGRKGVGNKGFCGAIHMELNKRSRSLKNPIELAKGIGFDCTQ